jgi:hypothetical protein
MHRRERAVSIRTYTHKIITTLDTEDRRRNHVPLMELSEF